MDRTDLDKIDVTEGTSVEQAKVATTESTPATDKTVDKVETPAVTTEERPVESKTETTDESKVDKEKVETERQPNRADRQYSKLLRERAEARARAKVLEEQLTELKKGGQTQTEQRQTVTDRPKRNDFSTSDQYDDAMAAWTEHKIEEARTEGRRVAQVERRNQEITNNIAEFKRAHTDYDTAVKALDDMELSEPLFHGIREEDNPAAVAYYLATHEDVVERINALPANRISRELGRISALLENDTAAPAVRKPTTSRAPAPVAETTPGKTENNHVETDEEYAIRWKKKRGLIPA